MSSYEEIDQRLNLQEWAFILDEERLAREEEHRRRIAAQGNQSSWFSTGPSREIQEFEAQFQRRQKMYQHVKLAWKYLSQHQTSAARTECDQALKLKTGSSWPHVILGCVEYELRQYTKALTAFNEAIRLQSDNAFAYERRGSTYAWLKRDREAFADWEKSIQIRPTFQANYAYACKLTDRKRFKEAFQYVTQAARLHPKHGPARYLRGWTIMNHLATLLPPSGIPARLPADLRQWYQEAEKEFAEAVLLMPKHENARTMLASVRKVLTRPS